MILSKIIFYWFQAVAGDHACSQSLGVFHGQVVLLGVNGIFVVRFQAVFIKPNMHVLRGFVIFRRHCVCGMRCVRTEVTDHLAFVSSFLDLYSKCNFQRVHRLAVRGKALEASRLVLDIYTGDAKGVLGNIISAISKLQESSILVKMYFFLQV